MSLVIVWALVACGDEGRRSVRDGGAGSEDDGSDATALDGSDDDGEVGSASDSGAALDAQSGDGATATGPRDSAAADAAPGRDAGPSDSGASAPVALDPDAGCPSGKLACNGWCVSTGQHAGNCTLLQTNMRTIGLREDKLFAVSNAGLWSFDTSTWQSQLRKEGPLGDEIYPRPGGKIYFASSGYIMVFDEGTQTRTDLLQGSTLETVRHFVFDASYLYYIQNTAYPSGRLKRIPLAGGSPEELLSSTTDFILQDNKIYYNTGNNLVVAPLTSPAATTTIVQGFSAWGFSIYQGYAYWREPSFLRRVSVGGGADAGVPQNVASLSEGEMIGAQDNLMFHSAVGWLNQAAMLRIGYVSRAVLGEKATVTRIFSGAGSPKQALELKGTIVVLTDAGLFLITAP